MAGSMLKSYFLPTAIIIVGFAAATGLSTALEYSRPPLPAGYSDADLRVLGSQMRGFAFGMDGLIADWYYMRSLQYIGEKVLSSKPDFVDIDDLRSLNPRLLYPLLNTSTDLDPNFLAAYYYGAVVLPAIDGEQAIRLTLKGIDRNPGSWRLYQHLGYIYWKLGQYDKAAEAYEKGSQIEGAAPFMRLMAGAMITEGGSRATARKVFRQMYEGTDDPAVKITAERRLAQLDALDEREAIDRVLAKFREKNGRCPATLSEVWPLLANSRVPGPNGFRVDAANRLVDPTGAPYQIDLETCSILRKPDSKLN
jgi:hypothetical protein